ncbi:MAG: PilT/PilU family type 4a pilus ATPase [Candidatus Marinimicrobia bacterium]|nr:PilT/PilU family type 4a pilus ATPase [Candidatus Neomarinimicrobiota bacterium]
MYTIEDFLNVMIKAKASDLYLTIGTYPMLRIEGKLIPLEVEKLNMDAMEALMKEMLSEKDIQKVQNQKELDFIVSKPGMGRFRGNAFYQRNSIGFVLRRILTRIPTLDELRMPPVLKDLIMRKQGLILVVGATGSGKSTTMAAMIDHRNSHTTGHILTVEDPIEFIHNHKKSIVNQREVGIDTPDFRSALKYALRQAPDLILIGEIRDSETMSAALNFSETGHLVLGTLHANNAYQTLERIMSFYPPEYHTMIRMQMSLNLQAIIGQRLVPTVKGARTVVLELLLDSARIRDLIHNGEIEMIRTTIEASTHEGMMTFDQSLYQKHMDGIISMEDAIRFADRPNDLRLRIRLNSQTADTEEKKIGITK